jgi:2-keto-4-pentenoate hydratase/2-oxohepta-3-ene-1,7-dioic acid hydratase in catechol pathway
LLDSTSRLPGFCENLRLVKLASFEQRGAKRIGIVEGEQLLDLSRATPELPTEMVALLEAGPPALARVREAVASAAARIALSDVRLCAPVLRPPKILAVGVNYADHAAEARAAGIERPEVPLIFNKQSTSIAGPADPIHRPRVSRQLDYEGELGIVIG